MYYVYVLQTLKDGKFYTGFAADLKSRIKRHNSGLVKTTQSRRPFKLLYYEACLNKTDALHREIYLKSSWGKRYIKSRVGNYLVRATVR